MIILKRIRSKNLLHTVRLVVEATSLFENLPHLYLYIIKATKFSMFYTLGRLSAVNVYFIGNANIHYTITMNNKHIQLKNDKGEVLSSKKLKDYCL